MTGQKGIFIPIVVCAIFLSPAAHAGKVVLAADSDSFASICHIDPHTGTEWFCGPFRDDYVGFTVDGMIALATNPLTHDMYGVLDSNEAFPRLIRFDARSFVATDLGNLGEDFESLAFDSAGTLYGVTGDNVSGTEDSIFTINTSTAAVTFFMALSGNDGTGEAIAYNPDDGLLYHWTGFDVQAFNQINLNTKTLTSIGVPAGWPGGVGIRSFAYDTDLGLFVGYRQMEFGGNEEYFTLTSGGVVTPLAAGTFDAVGIAFLDQPAYPVPAAPASGRFLYGVDPNVNLISQVDAATGDDLGAIGVTMNGNSVSGFNGLATDPTTGELFAVARLASQSQRLIVTIDPVTGVATLIGNTGEAVAGIAFDNSGTLYAVTGAGGPTPSTLFTVNKSTAVMSSVLTLSPNQGGESIAFDSNSEMMYRFTGTANIEAIDLNTLNVTVIPKTGDATPNGSIASMTFDAEQNLFFGLIFTGNGTGGTYHSITPGGVLTSINESALLRKGLAFSLQPAEQPFLGIISIADISDNGMPEIGVAVSGSVNVHIRDSFTDAVVNDIDFGADPGFAIEVIDDLNMNGAPEIAVLGLRPSGQVVVAVRDSLTGTLINTIFYGSSYSAIDMAVLPDSDGNGAPELAVLGADAGNGIRVQARDALTDAATSTTFYGNNATAIDVQVIPDVNGNAKPEIAMHARVIASNQTRVQLRDSDTRAFIRQMFFGTVYAPQRIVVIDDVTGDGVPELAQLARREDTGAVRIQVKNPVDGSTVSNAFTGNTDRPVDIVGTGGMVGMLVEDVGGVAKVIKRDALSGAFVSNVFMGAIGAPQALVVIDDLNGGGDPEFAALGSNAGQLVIQIKDTVSGAQINNINVP